MTINLHRRSNLIGPHGKMNFKSLTHHVKTLDTKYVNAMKNYKKNTGKDHPLQRHQSMHRRDEGNSTSGAQGSNELPLQDIGNELLWAGEVSFGGQTMMVDFDTGSSDLLVNPDAYDPSKSQSAKDTGKQFETGYGDGTQAQGNIYTDKFSIAGLNADDVAIGHANDKFIKESGNSGIAGMAFPSIQAFPKEFPPFFVSLKQQNKVEKGVFQFTIAKEGASLYLGGVDSSKLKEEPVYTSVDPSVGFWASDAQINGQKIKAVWDTGTTLILGPIDEVRQLFSQLPELKPFSQGNQLFASHECGRDIKLSFTVEGKEFTLGQEQTEYGKTDDGGCLFTVVGQSGMPMDAWVVGDSFFMAVSTIFDMDQNRVGFAQQSGTNSSTTPSSTASSTGGKPSGHASGQGSSTGPKATNTGSTPGGKPSGTSPSQGPSGGSPWGGSSPSQGPSDNGPWGGNSPSPGPNGNDPWGSSSPDDGSSPWGSGGGESDPDSSQGGAAWDGGDDLYHKNAKSKKSTETGRSHSRRSHRHAYKIM